MPSNNQTQTVYITLMKNGSLCSGMQNISFELININNQTEKYSNHSMIGECYVLKDIPNNIDYKLTVRENSLIIKQDISLKTNKRNEFYQTVELSLNPPNPLWNKLSDSFKNLGGGEKFFGFISILSLIVGIFASISQFTGFDLQNLWKTDKSSEKLELVNKNNTGVDIQNLIIGGKDFEVMRGLESILGEKLEQLEIDQNSNSSKCTQRGDYFLKNGKIVSLNLENFGIKTEHLRIINKLENLEFLNLTSNKISKMEGVKKNKLLKTIELIDNLITKIEGLEESESLKCLNLYENKITAINGISSLYNPNLSSIDLVDNEISDASGIKNLLIEYPKMNIEVEGKYIGCGDNLIRLRKNDILKPPINILKKGREETIKYFQEDK